MTVLTDCIDFAQSFFYPKVLWMRSLSCIIGMAPFKTWQKQFICVETFLKNLKGLAGAASHEEQQVTKLCAQVSSWSPHDSAEASEMVSGSENLDQLSKQKLLEAIMEKLELHQKEADGRGSKLQDYQNLVNFLPGSLWSSLEASITMQERMHLLLEFAALKLGLCYPTEATYGCVTCICHWPEWQHEEITPADKWIAHDKIKPLLKSTLGSILGRQSSMASAYMEKLPMDVEHLPAEIKKVFASEQFD